MMAVVLLTVSVQAIRAAWANPVDALADRVKSLCVRPQGFCHDRQPDNRAVTKGSCLIMRLKLPRVVTWCNCSFSDISVSKTYICLSRFNWEIVEPK